MLKTPITESAPLYLYIERKFKLRLSQTHSLSPLAAGLVMWTVVVSRRFIDVRKHQYGTLAHFRLWSWKAFTQNTSVCSCIHTVSAFSSMVHRSDNFTHRGFCSHDNRSVGVSPSRWMEHRPTEWVKNSVIVSYRVVSTPHTTCTLCTLFMFPSTRTYFPTVESLHPSLWWRSFAMRLLRYENGFGYVRHWLELEKKTCDSVPSYRRRRHTHEHSRWQATVQAAVASATATAAVVCLSNDKGNVSTLCK